MNRSRVRPVFGMTALAGAIALVSACGGSGTPPPAGLTPASEEDALGASSSVPTDTNTHYQTIEEMFMGRTAGVEVVQYPGCGVALRIRGASPTLMETGSPCDRQPLLVIDQKPTPPSMSLTQALGGLRPDDIDRITVLKDVSSTAVYGTRGAYGVVLITTKR